MSLPSHHSLSCIFLLGIFLLTSACGEPSEEEENPDSANNSTTSDNASSNSAVFNNNPTEASCLAKLTREECYEQGEDVYCRWYRMLELAWDGEACQYEPGGMCVLISGNSPGDWLPAWRLKEDGTTQVVQFEDTPQLVGETWMSCDGPPGETPAACTCADPEKIYTEDP